MKVKITKGTFGYRPAGSLHPVPVAAGNVCDVSKEVAERLLSLGVAVVMEGEEQPSVPNVAEYNAKKDDKTKAIEKQPYEAEKADYGKLSFSDLRSLAISRGLDMKILKSRAAITEALEAEDCDMPPVIGVSNPL